jgi:hypothetical protein
MTFKAIALGFFLFQIGFVIHVLWWRLSRPLDDFRALVLCFLAGPAGSAILLSPLLGQLFSAREIFATVLVTIFFGSTYIMLYPAAQAASPSMLLVLQIAQAGPVGELRESLGMVLDSEVLCRKSVDNLVHERFADEVEGNLIIAPRGAFLLKFLTTWRGLLGLEYGSG